MIRFFHPVPRLRRRGAPGATWVTGVLVAFCFLCMEARAQDVTFHQLSEPVNVLEMTAQVAIGTQVSTVTAPESGGGNLHFAYWTLNGERVTGANWISPNPVSFVIGGATEAVAHYAPHVEVQLSSEPVSAIAQSIFPVAGTYVTLTAPDSTAGYKFTFWTIDGVRQADPSGTATNPAVYLVTAASQAVAHYVLLTQDLDAADDDNGSGLGSLPDWWELRHFGTLGHRSEDDPDNDGFNNALELYYGLNPAVANEWAQGGVSRRRGLPFNVDVHVGDPTWPYGGVSRRRSAPVLMVQNPAEYAVLRENSDPAGVLQTERVVQKGSTVNLSTAPATSGGYYFIGWMLGTTRIENGGTRLDLPTQKQPIPFTVTQDTTVVARYYASGDADADNIQDWQEWFLFNSMEYDRSSDPEADGYTFAVEEQRGYSPVAFDELAMGGVSRRRSETVTVDTTGRLIYQLASQPATILQDKQYLTPGTVVNVPNKAGHSYSSYLFSWWDFNGTRIEDPSGVALGGFSFSISTDSLVTGHYIDPTLDTDADGIKDWNEWTYYGTLDQSPEDDTDGDGFTYTVELFRGQSPRVDDTLEQGGISRRRSEAVPVNAVFLPNPPAIGVNAVTDITTTSAHLSAVVNPVGSTAAVYFEWGEDSNYGMQTATQDIGNGLAVISVAADLSGLTPDKEYHFRAVATNGQGTSTGDDMSFRTLIAPPIVELTEISQLQATSVKLNGSVDPQGHATTAQFEYGVDTNYGSVVSINLTPNDGNTAQNVHALLTGLLPGTTYYYRLSASNAGGLTSTAGGLLTTLGPGQLDPSFGTAGKMIIPVSSGNDQGNRIAVQNDGGIVVTGVTNDAGISKVLLLRCNADGTPDATFGGTGIVTTAVGSGSDARALALQSDGKILIGAYTLIGGAHDFAGLRYLTNGTLDGSFGTGGVVTTSFGSGNDQARGLALQSDGKIVISGYSNNGVDRDFALLRYDTIGSLDGTFGAGGKVITPIGSAGESAQGVKVQSDGRIIAAGFSNVGGVNNFAVARYTSTGVLDTTFGGTGKVTTPVGGLDNAGYALALQSDGKIIVAGYSNTGSQKVFALVRYAADGSTDTSFGEAGIVTTAIGGSDDEIEDILVQPDGKIVAVGYTTDGTGKADFAVVRYNDDGSLDTTFNGDGIATTAFGSGNDLGHGVALTPNGAILVTGYTFNGTDYDVALARYIPGLPPTLAADHASGVSGAAATLSGVVNPNGYSTIAQFEYGTTINYGSMVDVTLSPNNGTTALNVSTNLTGLIPGTLYHYRLTATNAAGTSITVDGTFTTLTLQQTWRQQYFGTTANSGNAADNADPDGDGMNNLLEWGLGLPPVSASMLPVTTARNGASIEFTYQRSVNAVNAGVIFTVEWSDTMGSNDWQTSGVTQQVLSDNGTVQQVEATIPAGGSGRRFVHLRVTAPP